MSDDNDVYTPAQYREHQDGYGVRDADAAPHAGIVRDPLVSRYLAVQAEHYDPEKADDPSKMPGQARDLREVQKIRGIEATETARSALENGDMPTLKHLTGDQNQRADVSGIRAIGQVDDILTAPAPVIVILGEMGMGKTDLSGLLGQRKVALNDGKTLVASNIKTLRETDEWTDQDGETRDGWVRDFPSFKEWMEQDGDPVHNDQTHKLFIGDEFSVSAGGQGKQGYQTQQKLAKAIYLARKYRVTLIIIAHGPRSVHPLAWRVGTIIKKTSKKSAVIAERIKQDRIAGKIAEIDGIPPTDWRFDTADTAPWSWSRSADSDEDPEPDEVARNLAIWTVRECKHDGLSHRETARYVPYAKDWVGDRWQEIQNGQHQAAIDTVEALTA